MQQYARGRLHSQMLIIESKHKLFRPQAKNSRAGTIRRSTVEVLFIKLYNSAFNDRFEISISTLSELGLQLKAGWVISATK